MHTGTDSISYPLSPLGNRILAIHRPVQAYESDSFRDKKQMRGPDQRQGNRQCQLYKMRASWRDLKPVHLLLENWILDRKTNLKTTRTEKS